MSNNNKIPRNIQNIKPYTVEIKNKNINWCVIPYNEQYIRENENWKDKNNFTGCIYNTPNIGLRHINMKENVFIFEANMETNEINGMGIIIKTKPQIKKNNIYTDQSKNRYSYKGNHHFLKEDLIKINKDFIDNIEKMIFTGKSHMKRIHGISLISKRLVEINEKIIDNKINFNSFALEFEKYI